MGMKEREISLVDLIAEILLRWRTLLFVMAIGGLLLGTVSYMRSASTVEVQNAELKAKEQLWAEQEGLSAEEKWETCRLLLEEQLTDTQISNVVTAIRYEGLNEQSLEYKEQSVLMQIDPNQVQRGDIYNVIDSGRWNGADL